MNDEEHRGIQESADGHQPIASPAEPAPLRGISIGPGITVEERTLIEARVTNEKPSTGVAYLLWFFLGAFSAHRFYLGRPVSAILQILSYFILIGFIWLFIDLFLIPGMIRSKCEKIRARLTEEAQNGVLA